MGGNRVNTSKSINDLHNHHTTHTPKFIVAVLLLALVLLTLDPIGHHHLRMKPK